MEIPSLDFVRDGLKRVEALLREHPPGQHDAIRLAVDHLVGGGGKRIRPTLVLLSAGLCGAEADRAVFAAAAAEMLHTATLVHDDLVDGSLLRRNVETLNARWPPGAAVLTGDFLFARAADLAAQANSVRLMRRFAETLMTICSGEIRQMFDARRDRVSREEYEQRIYAKTASLLGLSAEAGPILAGADEETSRSLRTFGERLGLAFQVVDDVLDFVADEETLGKPVGSDLRQGLITLPLLIFLEAQPGHPVVRKVLTKNPSAEALHDAVRVVAASTAIEQALQVARGYADQARITLEGFPESLHRTALLDLAEFVVRRQS